MKRIVLLILLVCSMPAFAQHDPYLGIIPAPVSVKKSGGEFRLTAETIIMADSPSQKAVQFFADYLKKAGFSNSITDVNFLNKSQKGMKNSIALYVNFKADLPPEGYQLLVFEDHIVLNGKGAGLFYGLQTLIQLIQVKNNNLATIPCCDIKDYPRFGYRGMHLDVSRHFFNVDFIKRYLDVMAAYKLNTFHWHLTDDQGWRIEIKKYPKLTDIGSKRAQTKINRAGVDTFLYDNIPYEGYYTQDQIREVVNYASNLFITIVPEIELPGHSMAAVASYPELSCDANKTYKVAETWGEFKDVYCPTEETFKMLDDILFEVMLLFPGKYIHIGGDECNKFAWKNSDFCQRLIADKGLVNEEGLQSYFISRIEQYVNAQGHSIIGWDEILEGGLAPNATVMSWRGEAGGIKAAQANHDVIMTPGSGGMYFDHTQYKSPLEPLSIGGNAPLSKTYSYDPVPSELTKEQQKHIIGVQANLWTEYIPSPAKAEYMLLPRMLALAEVAWSPKGNKDYANFSEARLPRHLARLDARGYNYRVPVAIGASDTILTGSRFSIDLSPSVEGATIYYTLDGYNPSETDIPYTAPIKIIIPENKTVELKTIVITPTGKRSIVADMKLQNK